MQVFEQQGALNLFGRIRYDDIYKLFEAHQRVSDEFPDKCSCGYETLDWADHMREVFIGWVKGL